MRMCLSLATVMVNSQLMKNSEASYTSGGMRPLMINKSSTFGEDGKFNICLIDIEQFNIRIFCNWPIDNMRSAAVHVTNDRETSVVLGLGQREVSIHLFVTVHKIL